MKIFNGRTCLSFGFLLSLASSAWGQDPLGWNSARALELINRARERRELPRGDSSLQNYQAKGNGFVYFYLDRRDDPVRTLVKVDQIALDLFWKRPNLTKQRIVGMRDVSRLPNRMYYHLDHLTVVQNGFGDVIKIGDGDEVRDVPHPAAPGADTVYDYRLADSVTLQLGGGQPEVRVYQVQVRPKRTDRSALIGSVFVDRATADIVRMTFTFTPASYVDRRLDYINIPLDNGLFGGRYWLPNEQSVEIRRQIPELDFAAGAVIKGHLRVSAYQFNTPILDEFFRGPSVSAVSEAQRKSFPFPEDIYAGVNEEGLAPPPQMSELRAMAAELVREHRLSGLPPWRLYIPNASAVVRHDSAEGWYGGLGGAYVPSLSFRIDGTGGYAFGFARPEATVALHYRPGKTEWVVRGYYNDPRDIGPIVGMPGVLNTFASGFGNQDYTDLFFTRGVQASVTTTLRPRWTLAPLVRAERQLTAANFTAFARQPLTGTALEAGLQLQRLPGEAGHVQLGANAHAGMIHFAPSNDTSNSENFLRVVAGTSLQTRSEDTRTTVLATLDGGVNSSRKAPAQYDFLIGGRETLPGYDYRSFAGQYFAASHVELARTLTAPWVRARLLGYAAYTPAARRPVPEVVLDPNDLQRPLEFADEGLRASVGVGVGLLWDVIRVDVVKGAHWQTLFSVRKDFWDML